VISLGFARRINGCGVTWVRRNACGTIARRRSRVISRGETSLDHVSPYDGFTTNLREPSNRAESRLLSSRLLSSRLVSFLGAADPVRARVMSARGEKNFRDGVLSLSLSFSEHLVSAFVFPWSSFFFRETEEKKEIRRAKRVSRLVVAHATPTFDTLTCVEKSWAVEMDSFSFLRVWQVEKNGAVSGAEFPSHEERRGGGRRFSALRAFLFVARTHGFLVRSSAKQWRKEKRTKRAKRALLPPSFLPRVPSLASTNSGISTCFRRHASPWKLETLAARYVRVLLVHLRHVAFPLDDFVEWRLWRAMSYPRVIVIWKFVLLSFREPRV